MLGQTNQNLMLRKVLSPDITPPISDEEENTSYGSINNKTVLEDFEKGQVQIMQSESVKETVENRENVNKPSMSQHFQVKKQYEEG